MSPAHIFNPEEPYFSQSLIKSNSLPESKYVPTYFKELDNVINGFRNPNLIIIGGRPAMGCHSLALTVACRQAWGKHKVAFFIMSLTERNLIERVKRNYLCFDKSHTEPFPSFYFDYKLDIDKLRNEVGRLKREENIEVVYVDTIQMLGVKDCTDTFNKTAIVTRALWEMSREFDISIVTLSTVWRESELRGGEMLPMLCDLGETYALEMYADVVLLLHRPFYYGIRYDEAGNSIVNVAEVIVAKNVNGETTKVKLLFDNGMFVDEILPF